MTTRPPHSATLPVPAGPVIDHEVPKVRRAAPGKAGFTAQVLAGGDRRGLKGGDDTLKAAKTTYLRAEFSGQADRRPAPGRLTRKDV